MSAEDTTQSATPAALAAAVTPPRSTAGLKQPRAGIVAAAATKKTKTGLSSTRPGGKRHAKVLRDNLQGVTAPALRRLARRAGVKRINGLVYEDSRLVLKIFIQDVIRDAVLYTEHANRKTVTQMDVVYALKRQGHTLYGYGN